MPLTMNSISNEPMDVKCIVEQCKSDGVLEEIATSTAGYVAGPVQRFNRIRATLTLLSLLLLLFNIEYETHKT
jgi:hypothetical protein